MSSKEKISQLIEIVNLLTKRCAKIESDSLIHIIKLKSRIQKLEVDLKEYNTWIK